MGKVSTLGRTEGSSMAYIKTIRRMAKDLSTGLTVASTMVAGKMDDSMVKVSSNQPKVFQRKASGRTDNESVGWSRHEAHIY